MRTLFLTLILVASLATGTAAQTTPSGTIPFMNSLTTTSTQETINKVISDHERMLVVMRQMMAAIETLQANNTGGINNAQLDALEARMTDVTRRVNNTDQLLMEAGGATPEQVAAYRINPKAYKETYLATARAGIRHIVVADPVALESIRQDMEGGSVALTSPSDDDDVTELR